MEDGIIVKKSTMRNYYYKEYLQCLESAFKHVINMKKI